MNSVIKFIAYQMHKTLAMIQVKIIQKKDGNEFHLPYDAGLPKNRVADLYFLVLFLKLTNNCSESVLHSEVLSAVWQPVENGNCINSNMPHVFAPITTN